MKIKINIIINAISLFFILFVLIVWAISLLTLFNVSDIIIKMSSILWWVEVFIVAGLVSGISMIIIEYLSR